MCATRLSTRPQGRIGAFADTLTGAAFWMIALVVLLPSPFETAWAQFLLMLAPLVLLPLGLRLVAAEQPPSWLWQMTLAVRLPAALLLGGAFLLPQGLLAAALALPWLATTGILALLGLARLRHRSFVSVGELCIAAACVYVVGGSSWAVLDRWGVRPLDFEGVVVLLTAIHFHYAGFVLLLVTGLAARRAGGRVSRLAGVGVLAGVPLVAGGITATQLGLAPWLECLSAWLLALAGFGTAWLHVQLARQPTWQPWVRGLWAVAALSLTASMVLAALYGARFYAPVPWLDIPWMRALHGTANALGFGLVSLLAWTFAHPQQGSKPDYA